MASAKEVKCSTCDKSRLEHNEVGLCKKLLGRQAVNFLCMDCLADFLEVTSEELLEKIEDFKCQGCALFK